MNKDQCKTLFDNLYKCFDNNVEYIRLFNETKKCDKYFYFINDRDDLWKRINKDDETRMDRIIQCKETFEDEKVCNQLFQYCGNWHKKQLLKAFNRTDT